MTSQKPATIIIDDLGEDLDYERSYNLGKYVFERCKESNVQLISASNDNFLLDAINLEYWTISTKKATSLSKWLILSCFRVPVFLILRRTEVFKLAPIAAVMLPEAHDFAA